MAIILPTDCKVLYICKPIKISNIVNIVCPKDIERIVLVELFSLASTVMNLCISKQGNTKYIFGSKNISSLNDLKQYTGIDIIKY